MLRPRLWPPITREMVRRDKHWQRSYISDNTYTYTNNWKASYAYWNDKVWIFCVEMMLILCHPFSMRTYLKYPGMLSLLSRFFSLPLFSPWNKVSDQFSIGVDGAKLYPRYFTAGNQRIIQPWKKERKPWRTVRAEFWKAEKQSNSSNYYPTTYTHVLEIDIEIKVICRTKDWFCNSVVGIEGERDPDPFWPPDKAMHAPSSLAQESSCGNQFENHHQGEQGASVHANNMPPSIGYSVDNMIEKWVC